MKLTLTCGRKFHSDHLAAALLRQNALDRVITANPPSTYRRHSFPKEHIRFAPPVYLPGLAARRINALVSLEPQLSWWASRLFDRWASRHLGTPDVLLAWAWSARRTFIAAHKRGITCVLEETGSANAHQEEILREEYDRLNLKPRRKLPPAVIANERLECELADVILCPSEYVARSYAIYGIPREKCMVIPYATNPALFSCPKIDQEGVFRILYVGSVSARKGIVYLLQALQHLPRDRYECSVIGRIEAGFESALVPYASLFTHIPSVPYEQMAAHYQRASVFVLPTLDEGMAHVILEALCSGTPVITTINSGAETMIKDGHNGFIAGIRDSQAIAARLNELVNDRLRCAEMGKNAAITVQGWSWDDYARELLAKLSARCPAT
jgi:glycosyltransferase involved in cell wall biosynthesis